MLERQIFPVSPQYIYIFFGQAKAWEPPVENHCSTLLLCLSFVFYVCVILVKRPCGQSGFSVRFQISRLKP